MLSRYFDVMHELTLRHVAEWLQQKELKLFDAFKHLSFEIAARLMLGAQTQHEVEQFEHKFHVFTAGLFAPPAWKLPGTPYGKAWHAGQSLRKTLANIIAERRVTTWKHDRDDILGLLLQAKDEQGVGFTDAELVDELLVLLWAGHDTVTSLLTWTLYELLHNADVYNQLCAEQAQTVGDEPLLLSQLKQMPLLDRVLREAERLHPPAPGGFRGVVTGFDYGGYHIPAGWTVMYSIVFTHHMPELWHDPTRFNPDRFAAPHNEGHKPFTLIGFGGGPRVCVGLAFAQMQMRIIVSHLLRHLTFELIPGQSFKPVPVPTKMPKDGLKVNVTTK
jgi:cytochrome P450